MPNVQIGMGANKAGAFFANADRNGVSRSAASNAMGAATNLWAAKRCKERNNKTMNRRIFFEKLFLGSAVAGSGLSIPAITTIWKPREERRAQNRFNLDSFVGYRISWNGWIQPPFQNLLICQWIAWPICTDAGKRDVSRFPVYSSYPGTVKEFYPTEFFDVAIRDWQMVITPQTKDPLKSSVRLSALTSLLNFILNNKPKKPGHGKRWEGSK